MEKHLEDCGIVLVGGRVCDLVWDDDDEPAMMRAERQLRRHGIEIPFSTSTPQGAILLAEAVNWAAKTIDYGFYSLKPMVWQEASRVEGVESGWGDDGTFVLFHPEVGCASAHDPGREINAGGVWPHPWSGVRRQNWAFRLLKSARARRLMAWMTEPTAERREWCEQLRVSRAARA